MKLLTILTVVACSYAAKLDRTYLPPNSAATAGGSPGSLNAPSAPGGFGAAGSASRVPGPLNSGLSGSSFTSAPSFGQSGFQSGPTGFGQGAGSQPGANFEKSFGFGQVSDFQPALPQGGQSQGNVAPARAQASADQAAQILKYVNNNDGENFEYSFETSNGISASESGVARNGVQAQGEYAYTGDDGQNYRVTYTADENGYRPQGDHLPTPPPIPEEILRGLEKISAAAAAGTLEGAYNPAEDDDSTTVEAYSGGSGQINPSVGFAQPAAPANQDGAYKQQGGAYNQQGGANNQGGGFNRGSANLGGAYNQQGGANNQGSGFNRGSANLGGGYNQQGGAYNTQGGAANQAAGFNRGSANQSGAFNQQSSNGFSGNRPSQGQYNQGSSGQNQGSAFNSGAGQNQFRGSQNQGNSGYEYNRPQGNTQFGSAPQPPSLRQPSQGPVGSSGSSGISGSSPNTFGAQSYNQASQGATRPFSRPSATAQGSFGGQGSLSNNGPAQQGGSQQSALFRPGGGSFVNQAPQSGYQRPGSPSRPSGASQGGFNQVQYQAQGPQGGAEGYQYNRPSAGAQGRPKSGFGPQGPSQQGSQDRSQFRFDSQGSSQQGPQGRPQSVFGPQGPSQQGPQGRPQSAFGPQGPSQQGSQGRPQSGFVSLRGAQGRGQTFEGPSQPASFSEQEGYKY